MKQIMLDDGRTDTDTDTDADTTAIITDFTKDVMYQFQIWNDIFARISKNTEEEMTPEYCDKTQTIIDMAMKHWREKLKFSITPKLHAVECHVVYQMRNVPGFAHMLEQWIEHYHQIGHRYDSQWKGQTLEKQAELRANREYTLRQYECDRQN